MLRTIRLLLENKRCDFYFIGPHNRTIPGASIDPLSEVAQDFSGPVTYTVTAEDGVTSQQWEVTVTEATLPFSASINFQDNGVRIPPAGYQVDYGKEFGNASNTIAIGADSYTYGWKLASDSTPIDVANSTNTNTDGAGRNRLGGGYDSATDQQKLEGTLVHFQGDNIPGMGRTIQGNELFWELEVPNGTYEVTLGLGDSGTSVDSRHSATVEGYTIIPAFEPTPGDVRTASMIVDVTDGFLTVNGLGGFNSKITYINVEESTGAPVSGVLSFTPDAVSATLAETSTGSFSSNLEGAGAGVLGLIIDDTETESNDWLSLPGSPALGSLEFGLDATALLAADVRSGSIIATAQGYRPAVLDADLTVTQPSSECKPLSPLDCDQLITSLPVNLDFSAEVPNTLPDGGNLGTGFTAVLEHSEARRDGDLPISNPDINGYEPSLLSLGGGTLNILSQAGIAYSNPPESSNNHNQVNTLGVGLQGTSGILTLETKMLGITTGGNSAQAGIWFGFDEDNFVKLDVNGDNVELRREIGGVSVNGPDTPDQIQVNGVGVSGQDVTLRMVIDPFAKTITAFYAIADGAFVQVQKTGFPNLVLPDEYLTGRDLSPAVTGVTFAGIYATHRNGTQFTASFDDFSVKEEHPPLALSFDSTELVFNALRNELVPEQTVNLIASSGTPQVIFSDDPDSTEWLILPTITEPGSAAFGVQTDLLPGQYITTVLQSTNQISAMKMLKSTVTLNISEPVDFAAKVNFSDAASTAPAGYLKDLGNPYGNRGMDLITGGCKPMVRTDWISRQIPVTEISVGWIPWSIP